MTIFTAGHSTLSAEDFSKILENNVTTVIDVRSHPSSKWSWFWKKEMEIWLPENGFNYEWWPSLGGWNKEHLQYAEQFEKFGVDIEVYANGKFPKQRIGKNFPEPNDPQLELPIIKPTWTNVGLYDYQFFLALQESLNGINKLIDRSNEEDIVIICCEALPWKCHRSMISDVLSYLDIESYHIAPHFRQKNKVKYVAGSKVSPHSKILGNRLERYDPYVLNIWKSILNK